MIASGATVIQPLVLLRLIALNAALLVGQRFAKKGELNELAVWPQTRPAYDAIIKLESEIGPQFGWGWGDKPPRNYKTQATLPGINSLCWSCDKFEQETQ